MPKAPNAMLGLSNMRADSHLFKVVRENFLEHNMDREE
jgi:hypothetical protein